MRASFVLFGVGLTLSALSASAVPKIYGESQMVKIRPDTPPRDSAPVQLRAARNEFVSFQVVVHGGDTGLTEVVARLGQLEGPARIDVAQITLYRVDLLDVRSPSDAKGAAGPWPDPLVPEKDEVLGEPRSAFPFDVPARESRAIWVDVLVPEDASPGTYQGKVEVEATGGFTAFVQVELEVVDASLSSTSSYPTAFGIDSSHVCEAHTGDPDCEKETRANLLTLYARLALDHRFTLTEIFSLQPKDGQWDRFDAIYGPLLDGTAPTRLRGARMTSAQYMGPLEEQAILDFVAHFNERGWFARAFDYTADEPPLFSTFEDLRDRALLLDRVAPDLPRMVTIRLSDAQANGVDGLISRMSVIIQAMPDLPDVGPSRAEYDGFLSRPGNSLWLYQSCSTHACTAEPFGEKRWPSYMVDHPATLNRAMPWLVFLQRAGGESYYETAARLQDAWTDLWFYGGNGDGTLFYPGTPERIGGKTHVPLPSLRLKLLRAGLQDYEWLRRVSEEDPVFAEQIAREIVPSPDAVTLDPDAFDRAREKLIDRALGIRGSTADEEGSSGSGCGCTGTSRDVVLIWLAVGLALILRWHRRRRVGGEGGGCSP